MNNVEKKTELLASCLLIKQSILENVGLFQQPALDLLESCYLFGASHYNLLEKCENLSKTINFVSNN